MCNYCGIGLDAKIAYDFHNLRENKPHLFTSRVSFIQYGNKFIYTQLGGYELFSRACRNFSNRVTLKCNGERVKLPYLEGITVLNIASFAGGVDMWGEDDEGLLEESSASDSGISPSHSPTIRKRVSKSDGVLEIVGVSSVLHLGECQIGLSKAHRIAQAYEVEIQIRGRDSIPIQIDGEPMLIKGPASIKIVHRDTVTMLSRTFEKHHKVASKVMEVLSWAESKRIIDSSQKSILLTEFSKRSKI